MIPPGYNAEVDLSGGSTDADLILEDIRAFWTEGGPADFERLMELIVALDVHLQKDGALPSDWSR